MTYKGDDEKGNDDEEIVVDATTVPMPMQPGVKPSNEPPIPANHARFYCEKCHTPYDLPNGATSWRCRRCMTFNSTTPGECEWCTVL
eukprot:CAMPEP_0119004430 /NCGR_PEP_ID=MMETSP1176-20130426/1134_1 /TAXON_ID=265551 /ORGANISM="Synedropsis recta cf, Strain CCMP1620" /LENGTH=86 /DNA_ID=CAMNT_0006956129 /DNA_START=134 /DNA_END=394 /DNA_ORIENTATION=+